MSAVSALGTTLQSEPFIKLAITNDKLENLRLVDWVNDVIQSVSHVLEDRMHDNKQPNQSLLLFITVLVYISVHHSSFICFLLGE